eukprot:g27295.t1
MHHEIVFVNRFEGSLQTFLPQSQQNSSPPFLKLVFPIISFLVAFPFWNDMSEAVAVSQKSSVPQWPPTSSTIPPALFLFPNQSLFPSLRSPRWHLDGVNIRCCALPHRVFTHKAHNP